MEESETNEAPLNRTSPRIKREKSSPQDKAIYDINDGHTVEVQRNKRKKVSKDAKPKQVMFLNSDCMYTNFPLLS